ncbi:hypothetical protein [Bacteroides sp. 224]|uniref:hypothetical protein n=1 Tax=Bacteroides sp. 224 TaxID=2302936 RepID=UPI0013D5D313|nr:hypothetical protein [Bacteroides sp. 224]NDV65797.1 hypothetical protein [Bacteroides sp. 224]
MKHLFSLKRYTTFIVFLLCICYMHAQNSATPRNFSEYTEYATSFSQSYPTEKVYLHLDNNSYFMGETLWYKAYVSFTEHNIPSVLSKVLYVELWDQVGVLTDKQIIQIENGTGHGQFELKNSFMPGYYEIRAYTKWMLNFGDDIYFSRVFPLYKKPQIPGEYDKTINKYRLNKLMKQRPEEKNNKFNIQFFPEGGHLVQGIQSKVAFKVFNPIDSLVEISLYSPDGELVSEATTAHDGMGSFIYTPTNKAATVKVKQGKKEHSFTLPEALPTGYTMKATHRDGQLNVQINKSISLLQDTLGLFVFSGNTPYAFKELAENAPSQLVRFKTKELPAGVSRLTLINKQGAIVAERLFFVSPNSSIQIAVEGLKKAYNPIDPVELNFQVNKSDGSPLATAFSLSVKDTKSSDLLFEGDNIQTNLLLSSELKGYIHNPGYYFKSDSRKQKEALELLLLVQGWRKYNLQQTIGVEPFEIKYLPEQTLNLKGELRSLFRKKEKGNMELSVLIQNDSSTWIGATMTDTLGAFTIPLEGLEGIRPTLLQTKNLKGNRKDTHIMLDRTFYPPIRSFYAEELNPQWDTLSLAAPTALEEEYLKKLSQETELLESVVVKAKKRRRKTTIDEVMIDAYYNVQQILDDHRDKGEDFITLSHFLEEMNPYVRIIAGALNTRTGSIDPDEPSEIYYKNRPVVFIINGKAYADHVTKNLVLKEVDPIQSLIIYDDPMVIHKLPTEMISDIEAEGAHSDWTKANRISNESDAAESSNEQTAQDSNKKPKDHRDQVIFLIKTVPGAEDFYKKYKPARGTRRTLIHGYSQPAEFYSPDYADTSLPSGNDHRRTIFWAPNVQTDASGKASVKFYNNNNFTGMSVQAETLTVEGEMGVMVK